MDAALSTRVISELLDQVDDLKKGSDQKLTLCYFDGRGFGEIPRTMFAVSGTTFEDKRYGFTIAEGDGPIYGRLSKPEMDADAGKGDFDANLARLPVLKVGSDFTVGGSKPVARYIAARCGLNGANAAEAAAIDGICEIVGDIGQAFDKAEDKDAWFTDEATQLGKRCLPFYLKGINTLVNKGGAGFAVGSAFSMADAVIYNKFGETCTTKGLFGNPDSQPMDSSEKTNAAMAKYAPNLAAVVTNFGGCPQMKAYLANRGEQWF
jgi:glutathione S-transferase